MGPHSGKRNLIKVSQPAHGRDPLSQLRKLDYWDGEPGIKVQYPAPELEPAKRVKATNPEYGKYSARLNRLGQKSRHQGYAGFKEMVG